MIRKVLMSTVAMMAISGTAFAADLPSRRAPPVYVPPPIPIFTWTGFYIGGQVGYAFGGGGHGDNVTIRDGARFVNTSSGFSNGIIGGAHVGYNFAYPGIGTFGLGSLVLGVEGDIDGTDYRNGGGAARAFFGNAFALGNRVEVEGSARGRIGIAVDRALFYATGGAAFAQFQNTYYPLSASSFSNSRIGWTVGGGIEYAITTQWSLRAEYRYADFGRYFQNPAPGFVFGHRQTQQRAQVGFSYKFDNPVAPVVARY